MSWPRRRRREPLPQWWLDVLNSLAESQARRLGATAVTPDEHGHYDNAALDADQYAPDAQPRTRDLTRSGRDVEARDGVVDLDETGACTTCGIAHQAPVSCRDAWSVALVQNGEDMLRSLSISGPVFDRPTQRAIEAAIDRQHQRDQLGPWLDGFHTPECSRRRGSPLCSCPTQPHETPGES